MNWRNLYCPVCSNKEVTLWGKRFACLDCESADKPIRFKDESVPQEESRGGKPRRAHNDP